MKSFKIFFTPVNFLNYNKLKNENKQLKNQINLLKKLIDILQAEKESDKSALTSELNTLKYSIDQNSEKLESIIEQIKKIESSKTNKKTNISANKKINIVATIIATVFIIITMIFNLIGIFKMDDWQDNKNNLIIIFKIAEILICVELICHTGYLAKYERNSKYNYISRIILILLAIIPIIISRYTNNCYFDISYFWLTVLNIVLSGAAFIVTFLGNINNYT